MWGRKIKKNEKELVRELCTEAGVASQMRRVAFRKLRGQHGGGEHFILRKKEESATAIKVETLSASSAENKHWM